MKLKQILKRSLFIVGIANAIRGLLRDARVIKWMLVRRRAIAAYLRSNRTRMLHIGASNNILAGWLNTDIVLNHKSVIYLNATGRFPFDDASFDYIFSEHMIEHLDYQAAQAMLKECFRVLKRGGLIRLATPDLQVLLALHNDVKTNAQVRYLDWMVSRCMPEVRTCKDVFVINNAFRAWGHRFLYDQATLRHAVESQGFREPVLFKPGISEDPNLCELESHGREIQAEDINQFETMVIEARKRD